MLQCVLSKIKKCLPSCERVERVSKFEEIKISPYSSTGPDFTIYFCRSSYNYPYYISSLSILFLFITSWYPQSRREWQEKDKERQEKKRERDTNENLPEVPLIEKCVFWAYNKTRIWGQNSLTWEITIPSEFLQCHYDIIFGEVTVDLSPCSQSSETGKFSKTSMLW